MDASPSFTKFVLLCLLCTIMFNSGMGRSKVQCYEKDMYALLNFKQGITDPSGLLSSSWLTEQSCCEWIGVQCDNITSRVMELSLPCQTNPSPYDDDDKSHCLTGELNLFSLLELEFLSYLNLNNNDFKTMQYNTVDSQRCNDMSRVTPPNKCGNSSNLQYLDLSYNYGIVIDDLKWISHLSSLEYLNLNGISLPKEIDWLRSMTMLPLLLELHLSSCQLENLYASLQWTNFTSLQVLSLANNRFVSNFPHWLLNVSCDILYIDLSQNHIHGQLPKTLPNLRSIKSFLLAENNLHGAIPDWLSQFEHLQELDLSYNYFSSLIPTSLGNLSSLIVLNLKSNLLSGCFPESLGQLFNLEVLRIGNNPLTGNVSERNFHSLSKLKHLFLSSPALIFDFDPKWVPPFQLQVIDLGYVSPKLPSWLTTQTSLKALTILNSWVSFEPLDKFWNFAKLDFFSLYNNTMDADMSNVILNSKVVWFVSTTLRGGLPQLSPNVIVLNLANNSLSGPISSLLCHKMKEKGNLKYLAVSYNNLSGGLTNCWMHWKSLVHVDLGNNQLTGKIPHSMGLLFDLISLRLNDNKFIGDVPLSLKQCQKLSILDVSENKFSGAIPYWMGQNAKALQLRSNRFSGNISQKICQLNSLKVLDFANNELSGPIPNCLHNMTAMVSNYASVDKIGILVQAANSTTRYVFGLKLLIKGNRLEQPELMCLIDLSSNNLSGIVPSEIYGLIRLQSLNLSHNQFLGMIPEEIGNLKQVESIDLSCNQFSGEIPRSLSTLSFLSFFNLSFNNFVGKIPSGTQLQGFTNLSYMGNLGLCGLPLANNCTQDEKPYNKKPKEEDDDSESEVHSWFYMGMGIGFAVGFWGVLSIIFFNKTCRHAYFRFLGEMSDMSGGLKVEVLPIGELCLLKS